MRSFNENEEAEANWLAGSLLLPREALVIAIREGLPANEICLRYQVSKKMLTWRLSATGVALQAKRAAAYRRRKEQTT
jgi:Zn-dependent peptidase ImmA (M78 family)